MNRYSENGDFIIASNGQKFAVETPHLLPLPEGIEQACVPGADGMALWFNFFGEVWTDEQFDSDTHWLARRPLPEVPKVKTQEELDEQEFHDYFRAYGGTPGQLSHFATWKYAIAYARKGAK